MRLLLLAAGLFAAGIVLVSAFGVDEGEVVTLVSVDGAGARYETTLWIVEIDGTHWLRATRPDAAWLTRLKERPEVEVRRREKASEPFRASPVDTADERRTVNDAMARKYGAADGILRRFVDVDRAVPVRLDPRATGATALSVSPVP